MPEWADFVLVGLIGGAVGAGELLSRHRGRSFTVLRSFATFAYSLLNAAIAVLVLYVMNALNWDLGLEGDTPVRWGRALAAGFGAMAALRSSLFITRGASGADVAGGPAWLVQLILDRLDNSIGAKRTKVVMMKARQIMQPAGGAPVDYERAKFWLPLQCLFLLRAKVGTAPDDDSVKRVGTGVAAWDELRMPDETKRLNLGVFLIDEFGEEIVRLAVSSLGDSIRAQPPSVIPG